MFIVAQLGARMHYAVPSILARANVLERFYTDTYAPPELRKALSIAAKAGPLSLRRWLGRIPADIPPERICAFNRMGIEYYWRRNHVPPGGSELAPHLWGGTELCRRIVRCGLGEATGVYTFNSAGLELLQYARSVGVFTAMEQTIAPFVIEQKLLEREKADFPGWSRSHTEDSLQDAFREREEREWQESDVIVCGSEFVRESIRAAGGPVDRCRIVPYGTSLPALAQPKIHKHSRLRVLTVGAVGLRKGSQYVLAAARALKGKAEFRMAGPIAVTSVAESTLRGNLSLVGPVPRTEVRRQFEWADVFLLPSICEGSATVCYEALAYGLPVIATPNTGSVVRDGVDGFIVPVRDPGAIIEKLEILDANRDLLDGMSLTALERARDYTVERYGQRLLEVLCHSTGGCCE